LKKMSGGFFSNCRVGPTIKKVVFNRYWQT
jgi:hypothetical protein